MRILLLNAAMVIMVLLFSSYSVYEGKTENPVLSDHQKNIISYFKEIALGTEYGNGQEVTRRWNKPMKIYADGETSEAVRVELAAIVEELNSLIANDFEIQIVNSKSASNFHIFFGTSAAYSALYPVDARFARYNSGVFHFYWNKMNEITSGHVFINTVNTSEKEQRHVLREEITQSLGLPRDSPSYPESIFQQKWTTPVKFAEIDKELITLLYHPKMHPGLTPSEVEILLKEILLEAKPI